MDPWKPKKSKYKFRRLSGVLVTFPDSVKILVLTRTYKSAFWPKGKYLTHSIEDRSAMWPIPVDLLAELTRKDIDGIAIKTRDTKDVFVTWRRIFEKEGKLLSITQNGSLCRALPFHRFVFRKGKLKI